jgi:hypothetical protein
MTGRRCAQRSRSMHGCRSAIQPRQWSRLHVALVGEVTPRAQILFRWLGTDVALVSLSQHSVHETVLQTLRRHGTSQLRKCWALVWLSSMRSTRDLYSGFIAIFFVSPGRASCQWPVRSRFSRRLGRGARNSTGRK